MAKQSPLQEVKARFGSKEELAKLLYGKLEQQYEDESQDEYERRIRTMSNKKLLRLHSVVEDVEARFGSKTALVEAIVTAKAGGKNVDTVYQAKIARYSLTRLVDLHRQVAN